MLAAKRDYIRPIPWIGAWHFGIRYIIEGCVGAGVIAIGIKCSGMPIFNGGVFPNHKGAAGAILDIG